MPPKKKGSKKKEAKGESTDGLAVDETTMLKAQFQAMEYRMYHEDKGAEVQAECKKLTHEKNVIESELKEERENFDDITRDMTRQYKDMQEELMNKINALEDTNQELRDELDSDRDAFKRTLRERDTTIDSKDTEIVALKAKMEDMAVEFGDMLKETLNEMNKRIELSSSNYDEQTVPIHKRVGDFKM
jgi:predicted RNase H-like nuclease (RuvC/YqgF family)